MRAYRLMVRALLPILAVLLVAGPAPAMDDDEEAAAAVAEEFMRAFAQKDMARIGELFTADARVQRARLGPGTPDIATFSAADWLASAGQSIASVRDFRIDVLDTFASSFGPGVSVSLRFRATGAVDAGRFTNDGVDTFALAPVDGRWRIVMYHSFESLTLFEPASGP